VFVQPETAGSPSKGFEIYSESTAPQRVRVRGPASYIRDLDILPTERIDVSGRSADFAATQIPIKLANENTTLSDTVVDVSFHIGEKRSTRTFVVPVGGSTVRKATIVLYGPPTLFEGVRSENLKVGTTRDDAGNETPDLVLPEALRGNVEVRSLKIRP
jgi:YbbR domain-containing protein